MSDNASFPTVPISVIIPAYKHEGALAKTLDQILSCRPLPSEILLHFDGGWTPQQDFTSSTPIPIRVFHSHRCLGPGGGRNLLIHEASCELIASFDDDSWPLDPEYFAQAFAVMEAFPRAAIISPAVYLSEKPILPQLKEATITRNFLGSASVHRKSVHLKLLGYVPVAEAYGVEESDLSLQAHAAGYELLSCPWMRAWHDRPLCDDIHTVRPWIKNEVLLAYLRYPLVAQPWGWIRALRHIRRNRQRFPLLSLLRTLAESIPHCAAFSKYKHRYDLSEVWTHHRSRSTFCKISVISGDERCAPKIAIEEIPQAPRILYIQYANHGAYPPLEHGSRLLATKGAEIQFLGIDGFGTDALAFPAFPRIRQRKMSWAPPGFKQKLHYLRFTSWIVWWGWKFKAEWLYVSDPLACFPGLIARFLLGLKTIYHEHDAQPDLYRKKSASNRLTDYSRLLMCRRANMVISPNQSRLNNIMTSTGRTGPGLCVWNCPRKDEIGPPKQKRSPGVFSLKLLFHGSIVPERFPLRLLQALAASSKDISIRLVGYEPQGAAGYIEYLSREAEQMGLNHRFEYLGVLQRDELLYSSRQCDAGLCLLTFRQNDINSLYMAGASNKAFDYLSQGLAVVVPDDQAWKDLFVKSGCGVTSDLADIDSLTACFTWLAANHDEVRAMGERGRQLILDDWNYDTVFAPVLELITSSRNAQAN